MPSYTPFNSFKTLLDDFFSKAIATNTVSLSDLVFFAPKDIRKYRYDIRNLYNLTPRSLCDALKAFTMWYAVANAQQSQKAVALQVRFGFRQYGDFCAFTKRTFSMRPSDVINNPQLAQHNLLKNYPVLVTELIERLESLKQSQNHSRFFLTNVSEEVRFVLFSFIGEQ